MISLEKLQMVSLVANVRTRSDEQFSLPNLARQRKICRCELKHVIKSHWQISTTKMSALS